MIIYFYVVTNNINNKKYYGVHKTSNIDDGYMGSGVGVKRAIKKYGKENFKKDILKYFNSEFDAYMYEKDFVNDKLVKSSKTYNMTVGGKGGFSHIDNNGKNNPMYGKGVFQKKIQSRPEIVAIKSKKMTEFNKKRYQSGYENPIKGTNNYWNDIEKASIAKTKMSENHADFNGDKNPFYGKKHTEETKQKLSNKHKNRKRVKCPHCNKVGDISNMTRWHFDNCKKRSA